MPHILQNLRYLKENQVDSLQTTLNSSLKRTLHVYGHTMALCADMGIPPLRLTQKVQLAQLHFRQTQVHKDSIPGILYDITMSRVQDLPPQAMEKLMQQAQNHLHPQSAQYPPQVNQARPGNKEKSYKNWLRVQASNLWRRELMTLKSWLLAPGRFRAYVQHNTTDLERVNLYKPAPYLSIHHGHALDLIRLRTQAWPQYIPTHLHFSGRKERQEYQHRHCVYCQQQGVLGDETHIFLRCPATGSLIGETATQINRILRLFDAPPWSSFTDTQRVSILLGNPPPSLLQKYTKGWMQECVPLLHTYTTKLRSLLVTLLPSPPSDSEDGVSDEDP
jgi:hypothetical protein